MPSKATSILWPSLVAVLMPLDLADVLKRFPRILARLVALDAKDD